MGPVHRIKGKQGEAVRHDGGAEARSSYSTNGSARPTRRRAARRGTTFSQITAEQVFTIGTVNGISQPIVVGKKLKNVPKKGYWAWDPGGYIGLYKPDTFWMTD